MKIRIHPLGPDLHLHRVRPDHDLAVRLQTSFGAVAAAGDALADRFYEHLFAAAPFVRPLFPPDMKEQKRKLLTMLAWVVDNLEKGDELKAELRELGRRHEGYGAQPAHDPIVTTALIAAMSDVAGKAWNAEIQADWQTALERVADVMLGRT